ncbi:MAG: hypothetical protein SPL73_03935 [Cyanobacteriota bacterium]|nr:hypothetical protein [Cyanobacteriota bacterium]MDY6358496.1 hypothetical protein [Cyanobacteriota bacterium]MDY6364020.1 hypothetical protein [Cyanobacteriota bacterium]MDY6382921.1 hypothetical protein [Cyanobacteriota bacterium]
MNINPFVNDNIIQHRNMTASQKKNINNTREGVVVNSYVKDNNENLSEMKDTFLISDNETMPKQLYNDNKIVEKKLLPLSSIALGVMGSIAAITGFVRYSAKVSKNVSKEKWLPAVTRNVNLNEELHQVIYQMVQSPNSKTFIAGAGVLTLSAMAFMGKTFFDGFKEIWVKRKESDIQKNLQENLVNVETQAFAGKMQIIRSMLSKYTKDFEKYLNTDDKSSPEFGRKTFEQFAFGGVHDKNNDNPENKNKLLNTIVNTFIGVGTLAGIVGLGFLSLKNLTKSKLHLQEALDQTKDIIQKVVKSSNDTTKKTDKENLEHMFVEIENSKGVKNFIEEQINKLNWDEKEKKDFYNEVIEKIETSTTKVNPNIGGDGTPKPAFNSFVNDYKAFFYNWLLDTSNPQFGLLFAGITGITAIGYGGKLAGDALKEVQVKKINAQTELELQQRLVSTELRNFKAKKDAAVFPLVKEFYKQAQSGKRSKEELKNMAENVLFEIKNGPPFVYS